MSAQQHVRSRRTGSIRRPRLSAVPAAESVEAPEPFEVEIRPARRRVAVVPRGELDLATVERLEAEIEPLAQAGFDEVVLDLRRVSFVDSTGLCLIVRLARRSDVTVRLVDGPPAVARLFDLTGLRAELPFLAPDEVLGARW